MRKLLLSVVLLFSLPSAIRIFECVCVKDPHPSSEKVKADRRRAYDQAAAVFAGKVVALDAYIIKFSLEKRWKGDSQDEVILTTGAVRGIDGTPLPDECSYHQFHLGEKYLVYAFGAGGNLKTDFCLTLQAKDAVEEEKDLDEIRAHEVIKEKSNQ